MGRSNEPTVHRCYFAVVAVPVYAHAQNLRVGDAQKVVTIISSDKIKTQSYCEIMKLGEQVEQAYEKNDRKMIDELSQKIDTLEKILAPHSASPPFP
jgi:hypothetical protein